MLFAHLKRILKLDRLRLRGPCGARDEFLCWGCRTFRAKSGGSRAQPLAARLGRSVAFAQSAIAQVLDQYGFSGSKRQILHGKYDNPDYPRH